MKKKILAIILIMVMVLNFIPVGAVDSERVDISEDQTSTSLVLEPITKVTSGATMITSAEDLDKIRNNLSGKYYLANDIDMSNYVNWIPIGSDENNSFTGTLYGNGFKIKNLTIDESYSENKYYGLFGHVGNSSVSGSQTFVRDLILTNINFQVNSDNDIYMGGIAGKGYAHWANYSFINCAIDGNITVNTTSYAYVGGCIGSGSEVRIQSNSNKANIIVNSKVAYVGGLVGTCDQASIRNSNNIGNIFAAATSGMSSVGGLCGAFSGSGGTSSNASIIEKSFNMGEIKGESNSWYVYSGGLIGMISTYGYYSPSIRNCYNANDVYATTTSPSSSITDGIAASCGSVIGKLSHGTNCNFTMDSFYNIGSLNSQNGSKKQNSVGNLIGWIYRDMNSWDLTFENCYSMDFGHNLYGKLSDYRTMYAGKIIQTNVEEYSYYQLMEQDKYTGFDFENIWKIYTNSTYCFPVLIGNLYNNQIEHKELTQEQYVAQHKSFAQNIHMPENFGFYNKVWSNEGGGRLWAIQTWDVFGDIGEVVTFKFDDLTISADYYEMFLADIILKYNEQTTCKNLELNTFRTYESGYNSIKKALMTSDEWEKNVIEGSKIDLEINNFLINPDYQLSDGTYNILKVIFKDLFVNNIDKFIKVCEVTEGVFQGLDIAAQFCNYINKATDIVKAFQEAYKSYIVAKLYIDANNEFFNILYSSANLMQNTKYANWFKEAIDKYYEISINDNAIYEWSLSMIKDSSYMVYDLVFKDAIKNISYRAVANCLNVGAGQLAILTATYNITYNLLDWMLKIGKRSTPYYIMNYVAPVEEALCQVEDLYANDLISYPTLDNAMKYDEMYNLLRCVNLYLYQNAYDFCAVKNYSDDMRMAILCSDTWNNVRCHQGEFSVSESKVTSIQCPVNVSIYDNYGNLLLSIIDEEINVCHESITAYVFNGKKSIVYPANKDYRIKIIPRASGTMDYYVSEVKNSEITRQLEFYDLALTKSVEYTGRIPQQFKINSSEYALWLDDNTVNCNYDSLEGACINEEHIYGEWAVKSDAGICRDGIKMRSCTVCGKKEYNIIKAEHLHSEFKGGYSATCIQTGYEGNIACSDCGDFIKKGNIISPIAHAYVSKILQPATCTEEGMEVHICSICGDEVKEIISKINHDAEWIIIKEPTTIIGGVKVLKCKTCREIIKEEVIPATGEPTPPTLKIVSEETDVGDVFYVKLPSIWMKYKDHHTTLGFEFDRDILVKSVKWSYANWSVSNPEAIIESPDSLKTIIRPNGKGIGARSVWITVTVTDINGKVYRDTVKIRFYKFDWQKR